MKNTLAIIGLLFVMNAKADIEYSADQDAKASPQEVSKNRACFQELSAQGCGDPGDDHQQFRSCLNNVHSTLTTECQKMMSNLYGTK